jgi:hypothetical protein
MTDHATGRKPRHEIRDQMKEGERAKGEAIETGAAWDL